MRLTLDQEVLGSSPRGAANSGPRCIYTLRGFFFVGRARSLILRSEGCEKESLRRSNYPTTGDSIFNRFIFALAIPAVLPLGSAGPEFYEIDSEDSRMAVRHHVNPTNGNFHEFSGTISYDPVNRKKARFKLKPSS